MRPPPPLDPRGSEHRESEIEAVRTLARAIGTSADTRPGNASRLREIATELSELVGLLRGGGAPGVDGGSMLSQVAALASEAVELVDQEGPSEE
jgi:hypothetical protein